MSEVPLKGVGGRVFRATLWAPNALARFYPALVQGVFFFITLKPRAE